jgi:hypothetical protein
MVDVIEELFLVIWHKVEVVKWFKGLYLFWRRLWFRVVINKPSSNVWIQARGYIIEEILE